MKTFTEYLTEASKLDLLKKQVEAALAIARQKGVRVPNVSYLSGKTMNKGVYSPSNDLIWFSVKWGIGGRYGWNSTSSPYHTVFHELGHCAHHDKVGSRFDSLKNHQIAKAISAKVSRYAETNASEFVEELFAGLMDGKKYDEDVMRIYTNVLDGPLPQ